ncbi:hypothetical protein RHGRI_007068 [Rhododendron griersonianum]|uniref:Cystatin domain-containing protein n=1 Tax=Rhododendron griersonianum TaxID=479676 RepID=A0AAV6KVH5_9ERIC|nr:hypothetical protein RHGRI_007068 [Rhododendron griersonianum]
MHEMTGKEFEEYMRQIEESDGFDVIHFPRSFGLGKIMPIFDMDPNLISHSALAPWEYNEGEKTNLEFVKVVKANGVPISGFMYYITFDVKDRDVVDGHTKEFQARVWHGIPKITVELCRPKPTKVNYLAMFDVIDGY